MHLSHQHGMGSLPLFVLLAGTLFFASVQAEGAWHENPKGLQKDGCVGRGCATAVAADEAFIYAGAGNVLKILSKEALRNGDDTSRQQVGTEIYFRDTIRDMVVADQTLFVAATGDGLYAFDLRNAPALRDPHENETANVERVFGRISEVPDLLYPDKHSPHTMDAVFLSVDAVKRDPFGSVIKVAATRANAAQKAAPENATPDVVVWDYQQDTGEFKNPVAITTAARGSQKIICPFAVEFTRNQDGTFRGGLYVGYWHLFNGDLIYVSLNPPAYSFAADIRKPILDIAVEGTDVYVCGDLESTENWFLGAKSALMRYSLNEAENGFDMAKRLELLRVKNNVAGQGHLAIYGNHLFFGSAGPGRATFLKHPLLTGGKEGWTGVLGNTNHELSPSVNLWYFDLDDLRHANSSRQRNMPTASTMDWVFNIAAGANGTNPEVYVADEWGGFQLFQTDGPENPLVMLRKDTDPDQPDAKRIPVSRAASGMFCRGQFWLDAHASGDVRATAYSSLEGSGLWAVDLDGSGNVIRDRIALEWINPTDPGCYTDGVFTCPPPDEDDYHGNYRPQNPYPPALFVSATSSVLTKGGERRLVVSGGDRNTGVPRHRYLLLVKETKFIMDSQDHNSQVTYSAFYRDTDTSPLTVTTCIKGLPKAIGEELFCPLWNPESGQLEIEVATVEEREGGRDELIEKTTLIFDPPIKSSRYSMQDVAVYPDPEDENTQYVFVTVGDYFYYPPMSSTDARIHVFKMIRTTEDNAGGDYISESLGFFCNQKVVGGRPAKALGAYRLLIDSVTGKLIATTPTNKWPRVTTSFVTYRLDGFPPVNWENMDVDVSRGGKRKEAVLSRDYRRNGALPRVLGIALDGEKLYVADKNNGLYRYDLERDQFDLETYYPTQEGDASNLVEGWIAPGLPTGQDMPFIPLHHPVGVAAFGGKVLVQEEMWGRISILK